MQLSAVSYFVWYVTHDAVVSSELQSWLHHQLQQSFHVSFSITRWNDVGCLPPFLAAGKTLLEAVCFRASFSFLANRPTCDQTTSCCWIKSLPVLRTCVWHG